MKLNEDFAAKAFVAVVIIATLLFICGVLSGCGGSNPPPYITPTPPATWDVTFHIFEGPKEQDHKAVGADVMFGVLHSLTDPAGNITFHNISAGKYESCVKNWAGWKDQCVSLVVPSTTEVNIELERLIPPMTKLLIGREFTPIPVFASELYILPKPSSDRRARLREMHELGFNGVRVFAGNLEQVNQTPQLAREQLPLFMQEALDEGMYVYPSALTGTLTWPGGDSIEGHVRVIAQTCAAFINCLGVEIANEPYHATQNDLLHHPDQLLALARRATSGIPIQFALGASATDEVVNGAYDYAGGDFDDAHLDRGRDKWNMVRRIKEIWDINNTTKKAVMSGEPIGAAEVAIPGKRESDPNVFFAMGLLCRGFGIGCVFHSEDGLNANPLGPQQTLCATAFIWGTQLFNTTDRYLFQNAGWPQSPVKGANFDTGVVRAYSFITGSRGYIVLIGLTGDPALELQNGWVKSGIIETRTGVQVWSIQR